MCVCRDSEALLVSNFLHSYKWSLKILFHTLFFKHICLCIVFNLVLVLLIFGFILHYTYFRKSLGIHCCDHEWAQDTVS